MTIDLLCDLLALLCLVVLSCLWIWGIHGAFYTTGLNEHWFFSSWPDNMKKPVFDCPTCMTTVHVPILYMVLTTPTQLPWYFVFIVWIATAGVNFVIKEFLYPETE